MFKLKYKQYDKVTFHIKINIILVNNTLKIFQKKDVQLIYTSNNPSSTSVRLLLNDTVNYPSPECMRTLGATVVHRLTNLHFLLLGMWSNPTCTVPD